MATTEVRISPFGHLGLFASKDFVAGDVVLEENPLVVLAPNEIDAKKKIIKVPDSVKPLYHSKFQSMVKAGMCWMKKTEKEETKKSLLELYFPTEESFSSLEEDILQLAQQAVEYLQKQPDYSNANDAETLQKVMLIWACNAFQGGRVYFQMSRANHSCNPSAIIQSDDDKQRLVAATDIAKGDEITISYLGSMMYTETSVRNQKLQHSKFFSCSCARCKDDEEDTAARIPCATCHPRNANQSLDEDVQYDDDQEVQYFTCSSRCSKCQSKLDTSSKLYKSYSSVISKVVAYLDSKETSIISNSTKNGDEDDDDEILEEHVSVSSTIMGDKHWTTNLLLLLHLDRRLSHMSSAMLTTQEMPEMDEIAEAIDSLERLCRYVGSLKLNLDQGHILGDVIIGVARTLVALGDEKSQKYGAEWLDKIANFVDKFESEGRQKVVATLRIAWKKHGRENTDEDTDQAKKKLKS